jgi:hypothetical protein
MRAALRRARVAEATHCEAVANLHDAQTIRLLLLKDELMPVTAVLPSPGLVDLALVPGDPPRLWIDPIASVVMAPDPQTYRFTLGTQNGRELLLESRDRQEMAECVRNHIAHRVVQRERRMASDVTSMRQRARYSRTALALAWVSGFVVGALVLYGVGVYSGQFGW